MNKRFIRRCTLTRISCTVLTFVLPVREEEGGVEKLLPWQRFHRRNVKVRQNGDKALYSD